jgi:hypothetical protein
MRLLRHAPKTLGLLLALPSIVGSTASLADEWCYYSSGAPDPDCLRRNEASDYPAAWAYEPSYFVSNQWYLDPSWTYYWMLDARTGLYWYYYPATGMYLSSAGMR